MAGIRVAVKDDPDVKKVKISLSSRPYFETYGSRSKNAPCIQKLVKTGAIIVDKTKMTSFATWEEPTKSIDYPAPWNPRADGYLFAGGSNNGSGAAITVYEWLGIAVGSDSNHNPTENLLSLTLTFRQLQIVSYDLPFGMDAFLYALVSVLSRWMKDSFYVSSGLLPPKSRVTYQD